MKNIFITISLTLTLVFSVINVGAQDPDPSPSPKPKKEEVTKKTDEKKSNQDVLRDEIEKLKAMVKALESRLTAQEKAKQVPADKIAEKQEQVEKKLTDAEKQTAVLTENQEQTTKKIKDLNRRVTKTERDTALQRIRFSGDYRFEAHSIRSTVPAHFDGMKLQNMLVNTMFAMNVLGRPPISTGEIRSTVASNFSDYQYFTSTLTFDQLKQAMASFPPQMQQQLFGMLMPETFVPETKANNKILYTNRLRLRMDSKVADNMAFSARLSMYKVWGDSTGVQVFNGQPTSFNIDGTSAGVPNSDQVRVERAYFVWNKMGGSDFFLSIGRRPSTSGPPLNFREDEMRAGTPTGTLIDYQFDGLTFGYKLGENTILRLCYGLGYESGFGNGDLIKMPADRLKDVHFLGGNFDIWNSEGMLIQATIARAFDVTDGFNGLVVMPNDPLTGAEIQAPLIMRFTPSANLGAINLAGLTFTKRFQNMDLYASANYSGLRPNGITTPFGGMMSDPFETPVDRNGAMIYVGFRYKFGEDEKTKLGFEFNHGTKYWFNFAQAQDDIIAPKTNTRGEVYEVFLTHRLNNRFIIKGNYINYNYRYSGSGWHLGAPKRLTSTPILGFPTYKDAQVLTVSTIVRF